MIELDRVSFRYPGSSENVIDSVGFTVKDGEWVELVGGNASGKTTLCRLIAGIYEPVDGSVLIDGVEAKDVFGPHSAIPPVTITFQNPDNSFVTPSVTDEIMLGMQNTGMSREDASKRLSDALRIFELERYAERNPHALSGGEKQRLSLAVSWAIGAKHVILDEPFSFLDRRSREEFLELLNKGFASGGTTIVWATVEEEEFSLADSHIFMERGAIVDSNRVGRVERCIDAGNEKRADALKNDAEAVLTIEDSEFSFPMGEFSLSVPHLEIFEGEAVGVVGAAGSGKTTLLLGCSGLLTSTKGTVRLLGREVKRKRDFPAGEVGMIFQMPEEGFFKPTVYEEVAYGYRSIVRGEDEEGAVARALGLVGLDSGYFEKSPYSLSQGERRLIAVASVLVLDAKVYFLDEPTIFLDRAARERIIDLLDELKKRGKTIVIASHDESLISSVTDRTVKCEDGTLLL